MKPIGTRCPACQEQLEISFPDDAVEGYVQGLKTGLDQALIAISISGINLNSYLNESRKLNVIAEDLAEFLNEPVDKVKEKMNLPELRLAKAWAKRKGSTEEYYVNRKDYLYDNAKYNTFPMYQIQRLLPLMNVHNIKSLDIGCGIGTLVFMLAGQNNFATGYDVNPLIIDFCEFRKKKYGMKVTFTTEKPDFSQFDIITALGTLEHIEDLEKFVSELNMKSGAALYHFDDFGDQNISPMHFDHSKGIDEWLKNAGFRVMTDKWAVKR